MRVPVTTTTTPPPEPAGSVGSGGLFFEDRVKYELGFLAKLENGRVRLLPVLLLAYSKSASSLKTQCRAFGGGDSGALSVDGSQPYGTIFTVFHNLNEPNLTLPVPCIAGSIRLFVANYRFQCLNESEFSPAQVVYSFPR